jgi:hypothetical protein
MIVGSAVRVLAPFSESYSATYVIESIQDGQYKLSGIDGLFDIRYLEVA